MKLLMTLCALCAAVLAHAQILPSPREMTSAGSWLPTDGLVTLYCESGNRVVRELLRDEVFAHRLREVSRARKAGIVLLRDSSLCAEGYTLDITDRGVKITAADDNGFLYAVSSLRQLVRPDGGQRLLPLTSIKDSPRAGVRCFMLDSGRQYQRVSTIKKYIDMLCLLKMNCFQWHLTEGLGWRVEIRKYPLLTRVGASVGSEPEQSGYYSREEIREVVAYAAERGVTVIPEIDIPGHFSAALKAYPRFNCFDEEIIIPQKGFTAQILCAGKDESLRFVKEVLDEVCDLFPSPYIGIGGDEAPKQNWEKCPDCRRRMTELGLDSTHALQQWLTAELADHLRAKGRKALCWGDVVYRTDYPLPDNVVVEWWNWRGHKYRALDNARKMGLEVIAATNYYNYLNFPVTPWKGYKSGRTADLDDVYTRNVSCGSLDREGVIGMACALWTDYNLVESMLDERLFPRILAIAEQMWHRGELLPADEFYRLLRGRQPWFEARGFRFGPYFRGEAEQPSHPSESNH